jgi:hypothetical protein
MPAHFPVCGLMASIRECGLMLEPPQGMSVQEIVD